MKIFEKITERQFQMDLMITGNHIAYTRKRYNPLRFILGDIKRIDPFNVFINNRTPPTNQGGLNDGR